MAARIHNKGMRLGPQARQLSLFTVRPYPKAAITAFNRRRYEDEAARQLARCEKILAERREPEPLYRRCERCWGIEATAEPHRHEAA